MGKQTYSVVETGNVGLGQGGSGHLAAGESLQNIGTDVIVAITVLEDTTFTTLPQTSAIHTGTGTSTYGNSLADSDTIPSGVTLFGNWSAVTVNTGSCICYIG